MKNKRLNKNKMEKKLEKLKEKSSKMRMEILERLSVKDFKLFLRYDINEYKIHLLENKIKFIEMKGGIKNERRKEKRNIRQNIRV